jgi:hypothetical protein
MTIIVYKDGVLAADSSGWNGGFAASLSLKKAFKNKAGWLFGGCGSRSALQAAQAWFMAGGTPDDMKGLKRLRDCDIMLVSPEGEVFVTNDDIWPNWERGKYENRVLGQGHEFALGLLMAGKTAEEAVKLAIKHCNYVGGKCHSVRLQNAARRGKRK